MRNEKLHYQAGARCTTYFKDKSLRIFHHPTEPAEVTKGGSADAIQYALDGMSHHPQHAAYRYEELQIWDIQDLQLFRN